MSNTKEELEILKSELEELERKLTRAPLTFPRYAKERKEVEKSIEKLENKIQYLETKKEVESQSTFQKFLNSLKGKRINKKNKDKESEYDIESYAKKRIADIEKMTPLEFDTAASDLNSRLDAEREENRIRDEKARETLYNLGDRLNERQNPYVDSIVQKEARSFLETHPDILNKMNDQSRKSK